MAAKRNITDFFKPFVQAKRKASEVEDVEPITVDDQPNVESSSPLKNDDFKSDPPTSTQKSPIRETIEAAERVQTRSRSPSSLSPPSPGLPSSPGLPTEPAPIRTMRQLSPLSMTSSKSATPQPPPRRAPVLSPPPTYKRPTENNMSFMSTSTLTGPPVSSQSSSRRIVQDGQLAVTNSDEDSMDQDDDMVDEIDEMIRRKRQAMLASGVPKPAATPSSAHSVSRELRSSRRERPVTVKKERRSSPPAKKLKFDLSKLVKHTEKETAWDKKFQEYEKQNQQTTEDEERRAAHVSQGPRPDMEQVAAQLGGEDADAEQQAGLVRALKRMDALQEETYYHFFLRTDVDESRPDFPLGSLIENKAWEGIMKDQFSREEAFKTGFVADIARVLPLPDEILQWTLRELLFQSQTQLSLAYVCAIDAQFKCKAGSLEPLRTRLLEIAGRGEFTSSLEIRDSVSTKKDGLPNQSKLLSAIRWSSVLVGKVATRLPISEQRNWLYLLMLMLVDAGVQDDNAVKMEVQHSIVALMDAISSDRFELTVRSVAGNVLPSVSKAVLIHRLLCSLPSSGTAIHIFKRRLALTHFMKSQEYLNDSLDRVATTAKVAAHLKRSAKFKIRDKTDYEDLRARIGILDIAMGNGFSDFIFLPDEDKADTPVVGNGLARAPPPSWEETEFNEAIDSVVDELRNITSNIRNTGAANMQRLECKGMLDQLRYRLEYGVRTRAKPKRGPFNDAGGAKAMFQGYFQIREGQQDGGAELADGSSGV